jgi:hypothetical protein
VPSVRSLLFTLTAVLTLPLTGIAYAPVAGASPAGGITYTVPGTIDATGTTDVSDALSAWIANHTTDGTADAPNRIVLNGTYRVEYTLMIGNPNGKSVLHPGLKQFQRKHVILDLTNATLVQKDATPFASLGKKQLQEPRKRYGVPLITLFEAVDVEVVGGRLTSTNAAGKYSVAREPWHGVEIVGGEDIRLTNVDIDHVWGDFVYITSRRQTRAKSVVLNGGTFEANGRQGVTMNGVDGLEIANVEFRNVQRMLFDHEPGANGGLSNVDIHDNSGHTGGLGFVNFAPLKKTPLHDIKIRNHHLERGHLRMTIGTGGVQRKNLQITNSTTAETTPAKSTLITVGSKVAGFDGVVITGNRDTVKAKQKLDISSRSTNVVTTPNDF